MCHHASPPYSYGDSAGFTPDFPFNGAAAPTKYAAKMLVEYGKNKKGIGLSREE